MSLLDLALAIAALAAVAAAQVSGARRVALVGRACHEARGALTAARLGLHLARSEGTGGPLVAVEGELERVVLALEDLERGWSGSEGERVELGALVRESAATWGPLVAERGGRLSVGAGTAWVRGDRRRLAQALRNLVANAAEHGGGRVDLTVRPGADRVRVSVEDDGAGLPAPVGELLRAAERRARRIGARRVERRGHGLPVIAEVARQHGGTLASAPSARGARLVLELPAAPPPPGAPVPPSQPGTR